MKWTHNSAYLIGFQESNEIIHENAYIESATD